MKTSLRWLRLVLLGLTFGVALSSVQAQMVAVKGRGETTYRGLRKGTSDEQAAIREARISALQRHASTFEPARYELFRSVEAQALARLEDLVPEYTVVSEQTDTTSKRFSVVIEARVNATLLESMLNQSSSPSVATLTDRVLTFVFVARELDTSRVYDDRREATSTASERQASAAGEHFNAEGTEMVNTATVERTNQTVSEGSTERRAESRRYRAFSTQEVNVAVSSVLATSGLEVVNGIDAGLDVVAFQNDFSTGQDIGPATRQNAVRLCREQEIGYLATATLDIGLPEPDRATGLTRVSVTVTAQVSDLAGRFPRTVASITGVPYAGLGTNNQVALANALNEAATRSARELADQLRVQARR